MRHDDRMSDKPARKRAKSAMVRARVTADTKEDVRLLASLRAEGEGEAESVILREALALYLKQDEVQAQLAEARRREANGRSGDTGAGSGSAGG